MVFVCVCLYVCLLLVVLAMFFSCSDCIAPNRMLVCDELGRIWKTCFKPVIICVFARSIVYFYDVCFINMIIKTMFFCD